MAALVTTVAGRYVPTYTPFGGSGLPLGVTQDPGFRVGFTPNWDRVDDTDAYGSALIESHWLGFSYVGVSLIAKEWLAGVLRAANPGSTYAPTGATQFQQGVVGRRGSADVGGALLLTATAGTPAATSPATATFTSVIPRGQQTTEWVYGPRHRVTAVSLEAVAYSGVGAAAEFFSATAILIAATAATMASALLSGLGGLIA